MGDYEEKKGEDVVVVTVATVEAAEDIDDRYNDTRLDVHTNLYDGVQRKMEQRHIQMMALAGTLGTGLFLGSGKAIAHGGPAGALLAYALVGSVSWSMLICLGEMCVFAPISGGYLHFTERWLHPAVGFALGWQSIYSSFISIPTEIIAASILISYWDAEFPISHQAAYLTAAIAFATFINFLGPRWFGETEFWFAMIKIFLIVGLIIAGVVVSCGGGPNHERIGFRYWRDPGAFAAYMYPGNKGKFLGWFTNLIQAAYSYLGMESISIAAAEVKNPRVSVAKATKRVFYRIALFYILGMLVVGMLVRSDDPHLLQSTGTAASSPFVLAFSGAGIKVFPHIINAGVLTSAFSAANAGIYATSRKLYALGLRGHAPKFFAKTTSRGLPVVALVTICLSMGLSYMALGAGASTVLNWLSNITSLSGFITWAVICSAYLRFYAGVKVQGLDRKTFHYAHPWQPFPAYWAIFWSVVVIVFNGWYVFTKGNWSTSNFIVSYINLPIFASLTIGFIIIKRPKVPTALEQDFVSNIPTDEEVYYEEPEPKTWFHKVCNWLFT